MKILKELVYHTEDGTRCYSRKDVADRVNVSTQTLRLWEEAGLIPQPIRDDKEYRFWTEEDLKKIEEYATQSHKDRYGRLNKK